MNCTYILHQTATADKLQRRPAISGALVECSRSSSIIHVKRSSGRLFYMNSANQVEPYLDEPYTRTQHHPKWPYPNR